MSKIVESSRAIRKNNETFLKILLKEPFSYDFYAEFPIFSDFELFSSILPHFLKSLRIFRSFHIFSHIFPYFHIFSRIFHDLLL